MTNSPFTAAELAEDEMLAAQEEFSRWADSVRAKDAANDELYGDFERFNQFDDVEGF